MSSKPTFVKTSGYWEKQNDPPAIAVIDLCDYFGNGYVITRLSVAESMRGRGVATRLLERLCQDADKDHVRLWLEFAPYHGTDPDRLARLYTRFGFVEAGGIWVRRPK